MTDSPTDYTRFRRTLSQDRCYWALLTAHDLGLGSLPRRLASKDREAAAYAFEELVPLALDELHAVYHRLDHDRLLCCAVELSVAEQAVRDGMRSLKAERNPPALFSEHGSEHSIGDPPGEHAEPDRSHEPVYDDEPSPQPPELLVGAFAPLAVRRSRRRRLTLLALAGALTLVAAAVGVERRVAHAERAATQLDRDADRLRLDALGPAADDASLPPAARLTQELRRLRAVATPSDADPAADPNAPNHDRSPVHAAAELLERWPADAELRLQSIVVTPDAFSLRLLAPSEAASNPLANALASSPRWDAPSVSSVRRSDGSHAVTINARSRSD